MEMTYYVVNRETGEKEIYHHGNHDQSTHGNWARRGAAAISGRIHAYQVKKKRQARVEKARATKAAKKAEADKKKAEEEAQAKIKAEREAAKQKILESGTADQLYKIRGELTADEINRAINRLNTEARLYELTTSYKQKTEAGKQASQQIINNKGNQPVNNQNNNQNNQNNQNNNKQNNGNNQKEKTKLEVATDKMNTVSNFVDAGAKLYNVGAKINNTFNKSMYLPVIDTKNNRKAEEEKKKKQKVKENEK